MASSRSKTRGVSRTSAKRPARHARSQQISSEEAIRAGEQIAMAAFASGLKLAAAFGTVAAKTAGLALQSLATGADKFSQLVKEEAIRSNREKQFEPPKSPSISRGRRKKSSAHQSKK